MILNVCRGISAVHASELVIGRAFLCIYLQSQIPGSPSHTSRITENHAVAGTSRLESSLAGRVGVQCLRQGDIFP